MGMCSFWNRQRANSDDTVVLNNLRANSHPPDTDCSEWNLLAKTERWTQGQSIRYSVTIVSGLIDSVYLQSACTKLSAIRHLTVNGKYFYISHLWLLAAGWCWWEPQWRDHGLMAPGPGYNVSSVLAISLWHFYSVLNNIFMSIILNLLILLIYLTHKVCPHQTSFIYSNCQ